MVILKRSYCSAVLFLCVAVAAVSCGDGSSAPNMLSTPKVVAVDSSNDRVAVVDEAGQGFAALSFINAATDAVILGQPAISRTLNTSLQSLLTASPLGIVAAASPATATTTRAFVIGAVTDATTGDLVTNRIAVFDFDGTTPTVPSFSPISVSNGGTTDTTIALSQIALDDSQNHLFVIDKTNNKLHVYSTVDGSEDASSPINLINDPQGFINLPTAMAIDTRLRRLFIASNAGVELAQQIVTSYNLDNLSDTTQFTVAYRFSSIDVVTNAAGTVLAGIVMDQPLLALLQIDAAVTSATEIATLTNTASTTTTDETTATLITGTLSVVKAVRDSQDILYVYAGQSDGNTLVAKVSADLTAVTTFALATSNGLQESIDSLNDPTTGTSEKLYISSVGGGDVISTAVGDTDFTRIP